MQDKQLPEWEALLSSVAHLQTLIPDAVLVGGTAAATYARHRLSVDHNHTLSNLKERFDEILGSLESVAGWETARVRRPVLIRNATRDYLDVAAMGDVLGDDGIRRALTRFDELYPQTNNSSPLQQLANQLAKPMPFDLEDTDLGEYKQLVKKYQNWETVKAMCCHIAVDVIHAML